MGERAKPMSPGEKAMQRASERMSIERQPEPKPHPFDVCYCGDYRHQHVNGVGKCKLENLCTPWPCQKFRFVSGPSEADRMRTVVGEDAAGGQNAK